MDRSGFKYRFLWTWDHSTNWDLSRPGQQEEGCNNPYLKPPGAFISDYRMVIDFISSLDSLSLLGFTVDEKPIENAIDWLAERQQDKGL